MRVLLTASALALIAALSLTEGIASAVTPCTSSISSCGCTITHSGIYNVTTALFGCTALTSNGDCIDVASTGVTLGLNGKDIEGGCGGTVGVRLLSNATGARVKGGGSGIFGWTYGIEDDANNALIFDFLAAGNGTGVFVNGATGSKVGSFEAFENDAGVQLKNANGNNVTGFFAAGNGGYGVWLDASDGNVVSEADVVSNGDDDCNSGIYVGCNSTGGLDSLCTGITASENNRIYLIFATSNDGAGIAVDLGDTGNLVTSSEAFANDKGECSRDDLMDENFSDCDNNLWYENDFDTSNQACIDEFDL